jgi:hypothetical protein
MEAPLGARVRTWGAESGPEEAQGRSRTRRRTTTQVCTGMVAIYQERVQVARLGSTWASQRAPARQLPCKAQRPALACTVRHKAAEARRRARVNER